MSLDASLQVTNCTQSSACVPRTSISPMWLTSKSPAAVRVARCSLTIPEYSTGMSQPPKLTILAPRRRCVELSAVLRSCVVVASITNGPDSSGKCKLTLRERRVKEAPRNRGLVRVRDVKEGSPWEIRLEIGGGVAYILANGPDEDRCLFAMRQT